MTEISAPSIQANDPVKQKIRSEFVRNFLSMGGISVTADIFAATLVLYIAWIDGENLSLLLGYTIVFLLNIQLFINVQRYKKLSQDEQDAPLWYQRSVNMTLLHGTGWGIFTAAAFFAVNEQGFIYIMLILMTLTISAVPVLSQLYRLFAARTILILAPTTILAISTDRFEFPFIVMLFQLVFPLMVLVLGFFQYTKSLKSTGLHIQNELMLVALDKEITEREKVEQNLREAVQRAQQADAAKSRFLANISHEIRTPLTAIRGLSELIVRNSQLEPKTRQKIEIIFRNSEHLSSIINDVLDMAKAETGKLGIQKTDSNPAKLISDVCANFEMLCQEKGLIFKLNYHFPLPTIINTDPTRLRQILFNLLNNAMKFTSIGFIEVNVSCLAETNTFVVEVCDSGIGLEQSEIDKLFNPFVQANENTSRQFGGTGLGLAISKELAELLGGNLTVKSKKGEGCCFTLTLTDNAIPETSFAYNTMELFSDGPNSAPILSRLGGKVLVAEDNQGLQLLLGALLETASLEYDLVSNGRDAVESALHNDYDLVLMDMHMPELDGISATMELRNRHYEKPILALTANVDPADLQRFWDAGINGLLHKPVDNQIFYATLSKYLPQLHGFEVEQSGSDIYDEFRLIFLTALRDALNIMQQALRNNDFETLHRAAHDIKGQAKGLKLGNISLLAENLEQQIKIGPSRSIAQALHQLEEQCLPLLNELQP